MDGPAKSKSPVDRCLIPLFIGVQPKVVQDFATIHSMDESPFPLGIFLVVFFL